MYSIYYSLLKAQIEKVAKSKCFISAQQTFMDVGCCFFCFVLFCFFVWFFFCVFLNLLPGPMNQISKALSSFY